jgi:hypothetical protein
VILFQPVVQVPAGAVAHLLSQFLGYRAGIDIIPIRGHAVRFMPVKADTYVRPVAESGFWDWVKETSLDASHPT